MPDPRSSRSFPNATIHIEGSLEPEMMLALAQRNSIPLPYPSVEAARQAYRFRDLGFSRSLLSRHVGPRAGFLRPGLQISNARARTNVGHVEMFFDPQGHTARGIPFATVVQGLHRAIADAARTLGVQASLIMCFLRHLDEADAERTLDSALAFRDRIVGVGLEFVRNRKSAEIQACISAGRATPVFFSPPMPGRKARRAMSGKRSTCSASRAWITANSLRSRMKPWSGGSPATGCP